MDGLSFTNIGNFRLTPGEIAIQTELSSKVQAKTAVKKIDNSHKTQTEKDDNKKRDLQGRFVEDNEENNEEDLIQETPVTQLESNLNKYKVRLNSYNDMVELVDQTNGRVIETIAPDDLIKLVSKTRNPSGILVDKQI